MSLKLPYKYPDVLRTIKPTVIEVDGVKIAMTPNTDVSFKTISNQVENETNKNSTIESFGVSSENKQDEMNNTLKNVNKVLELPKSSQGHIIFYN